MKKCVVFILALSVSIVLFSGCGTTQEQIEQYVVPDENPSWQTVSIAPEDYGIDYGPDYLEDWTSYPLDKLVAYFLGTDGAYAEGSGDEFYKRFMDAPNTVLNYIALIDDENAQDLLCSEIACADVYWYEITDEFKQILEECTNIYPSGKVADVISTLNENYERVVADQKQFLEKYDKHNKTLE